MHRAIGTAVTGLGVTIASTFASSLGLSLHQQRVAFGVGVVLMMLGGWLFVRGRKAGARAGAAVPRLPGAPPPKFNVGKARAKAVAKAKDGWAREDEQRERIKREVKEEREVDERERRAGTAFLAKQLSDVHAAVARPTPGPGAAVTSASPRQLADRLGRLHEDGRRLRQHVKPDDPSPFQTIAQGMFRYPNVSHSLEEQGRRWSDEVRDQLTLSAVRFVPEWETGPSLPNRQSLGMVGMMFADGLALVTFLDARLGLLRNIINELRRS
jgi:hypothetical protein